MYARGSSSERPYQILNDPQVIEIAPKNVHPIFAKFSGVGAKFLRSLYGDAQGPSEKKIGNCTLAHFPDIEFGNFAENRFFFELREIASVQCFDAVG